MALARWPFVFLLAGIAAASGCGDDGATGGGGSNASTGSSAAQVPVKPEGGVPLLGSDCDALVPTICGLPFPSNVYLAEDPTGRNPSGKSVRVGETTMPANKDGVHVPPAIFYDHDGFSPGQALMTHFPAAVVDGCATPYDIERSLDPDSPTVLIEADTLRHVPHWVDLDMSTPDDGLEGRPDRRLFMIRPAERLRDGARYVVGIRGIRNRDGNVIPPTPVFDALRQTYILDGGTDVEKWTVYARRGLYSEIFAKLELAGVPRQDLQIAWDFTTATKENNTRYMVQMRDLALEEVGEDGPTFEVLSVEEFPTEQDNAELLRRIEVRMTVPLYLTGATVGLPTESLDRLVLDDEGKVARNATTPSMEQDVLILVPRSVLGGEKHGLLQNGHGLFGTRYEGRGGYLARAANGQKFIAFATNYFGFDEDSVALASQTLLGDFDGIKSFTERQIQGMVNQLLAMRMMKGRIASTGIPDGLGGFLVDPAWIDSSIAAYRGDSQGGIMGATYMAVTTDVTRGLLGEPGTPYNMILNRSVDWPQYGALLGVALDQNGAAIQQVLGLFQLAWDRSEPMGYAPYIEKDLLPGNTEPHHVLLHVARGDHQVSSFGAHILARAIGAKQLVSDDPDQPVWETIFGLDQVSAPQTDTSLLIEYDFGLPPNPAENLPNASGCDPHDRVRDLQPSYDQQGTFFRTGEINWTCDGACNCDDTLADVNEELRCRETFADQCR
jgi:hypothetical protein